MQLKYTLILFTIISITGLILITILFDINVSSSSGKNISPPRLSNIGPHRKFIDEKTCLGCHQTGLNIPGVGLSPKIPHEFRRECISCHILPV